MDQLGALGLHRLNHNHRAAEQLLKRLGATFRLYNGEAEASERILPFDPLPRLIDHDEWQRLDAGLVQRLEAIDRFLADVYGEQKILDDGVIPREDVLSSQGWRPQMLGQRTAALRASRIATGRTTNRCCFTRARFLLNCDEVVS